MFEEIKVGQIVPNLKGKNLIQFDVSDSSCMLSITWPDMSDKESEALSSGKLEVRTLGMGHVLFMLFKFEGLPWVEAPYSPHLSKNLSEFPDIEEGQGLALVVQAAESKTGEVKVLRMIGLPTKFSRTFIKTLQEMMADVPESIEAYRMEVSSLQDSYTIDQLVSYSEPGCKLKEC